MVLAVTDKYDEFFTDDKLNIKPDVVGFAQLIEQEKYVDGVESAKVYAISAEFGIGKTFFCERLKDVLLVDNVPVTKMNIWEMDFYEDPLIPILINIQEIYKQNNPDSADFPNPSKMLNLFKSIVAGITIEAKAPYIGKVIIDGEKIIKNSEVLKQKALDTDIYAEYKQYKTELDALKEFLRNWAKEIDKPIVIIIDELDRCRPDYAVKTLEVLKHFFDIPGFVFVLALDEKQLENSVKCLFGTENFDGYKRKFINNSFLLRVPDKEKFTDYLYAKSGIDSVIEKIRNDKRELVFKIKKIDSYADHLQKHFGVGNGGGDIKAQYEFNNWQTSEQIIKRYFAAYSIWFKFTLRQMEQVFDRLVLFTKNIAAGGELFSPDLAVLLVCLHEFDPKIYNALKKDSKIYGANFGIINKIYAGEQMTSLAWGLYEKESHAKFEHPFNRKIVPKMPLVYKFSTTQNNQPAENAVSNIFNTDLYDNVDRFFELAPDNNSSTIWLIEFCDKNTGECNNIDTNGVLAHIISDKRDARWETPENDINRPENFDLQKFREMYFDKMDFITSRFASQATTQQSDENEKQLS